MTLQLPTHTRKASLTLNADHLGNPGLKLVHCPEEEAVMEVTATPITEKVSIHHQEPCGWSWFHCQRVSDVVGVT